MGRLSPERQASLPEHATHAGRRYRHQAARGHARRTRARCRPRTTSIPPCFRARDGTALRDASGSAPAGWNRSSIPGSIFVREVLGESIIVTRSAAGRGAGVLQRLPPSRHAAVRRGRRDSSPAASSARTTRGPTGSTAGCSARRTWTRCRTSARRTIRCTASTPRVWDGHVFLILAREPRAAVRAARRPARRSSAPWRMQDLRLGHRIVYDVKRELEADHPELQRVPALPEPAPGAQQAVALPERRERAAPPHLHGRPDGSARRRRHDVDGRELSARDPAGLSDTERRRSTTTRSSRTCS